jgi:hypothetical protein
MDKTPTHVCTKCRSQVVPRSIKPGSAGVELVFWFLLILPGVIYSIWRITSRYLGCPTCFAKNLLPLDSPAGRTLARISSFSKEANARDLVCP